MIEERSDRPRQATSSCPRVLVVGTDLLAEALARALATCGIDTKQVRPRQSDLRRAFGWQPRLVLLDVRALTDGGGTELVTQFRQRGVGVCVLDGESPADEVETWLEAGVSAMIDKGSPLGVLVRTIGPILDQTVGEGVRSPSPGLALRASHHVSTPSSAGKRLDERHDRRGVFAVLTERERHVLAELIEGHCAEEIANAASVSISTVRSQIKSILQKLGVSSQLAAVALARRAGWSIEAASR